MSAGAAVRARSLFVLSAALGLGATRVASAAPSIDAEFVDRLTPRNGRHHPLTDAAGKLPVVVELPPFADPRALGWLPLGAGFATQRLFPSELATFASSHPAARFSIWPGLHPVLDESARRNRVGPYKTWLRDRASSVSGTGKGVVVGIVDTGIDVSHPDLRDASGRTRVAWLLDFSGAPSGRHAALETKYGCNAANQARCAVLDSGDIDAALAGSTDIKLPIDAQGHGTHVTSIAAGNGGADARFVGGAPAATLMVAALGAGGADESVTDVDIVTATRFIFDRAEEMGLPAVVNLSLGGDFGPHDGTSPLERALSDLVGPSHSGRSIVVAAGNSGALYRGDDADQVLGIHTEVRVTSGLSARLPLFTPDAPKGSQVSGTGYVWLRYGDADHLAISLEGPGGLSIPLLRSGEQGGGHTVDDSLQASIYNGVVSAATPLTDDSRGAIIVWSGRWPAEGKITIGLEGEGFVGAWVEGALDDVATTGEVYFELASRAGTINVPATSPNLIAVGCTINRTQWFDRNLAPHDIGKTAFGALSPADSNCYFSSAGPTATGLAKPDLSAPGALVVAAMSRDAVPGVSPFSVFSAPPGICEGGGECLVVDDRHAILSGSSMSSPQVAGAVALLFENDATLTQPDVLRLLQAGARRPTGPITADYQLGVGALDIAGSAAVLEASKVDVVRDPDAAASWLTLSSNYLHPDDGSPIVGSIALRTASGEIADHFDERRLSIDLGEEGVLSKAPAREGPGLYRFAIRANRDTGSTLLRLDVRWDSTTLGTAGTRLSGARLVPIGGDRWIAAGSARPYGGCAVIGGAPRAPVSYGDFAASFAITAMVTLTARRRRVPRRITAGRRRASPRKRAVRTALDRDRTDRRDRDRRH